MRPGGAGPEPVAVVAAGLKAPGGNTPDELWSSLCEGRSFAQPFQDDRLQADACILVGLVTGFDPATYLSPVEVRRLDRSHHLAVGAAQDARDSLTGPVPPPERCAVVCGVGLGATATYEEQHANLLAQGLRGLSPLTIPLVMPSATAALLSLRFGFRGPCLTVSTACASGATAIGEGVELLRRGAADLVLAGGVDSMVTYNALCSFLRLDVMTRNVGQPQLASRPFDVDRDGFLMAEGAGFVLLKRLRDADEAGDQVLGRVAGYGASADAHHLVAPPDDGEGALRCMQLALDDADVSAEDVNHVNAHGTSTRLNDLADARAVSRLFAPSPPAVTAVKGTTGHMIGGSGAVETIVTLWSLRHELVPPVAGLRAVDPAIDLDVVTGEPRKIGAGYGLTNSFGFGGANASLLLAAPQL
ncbi:MAG: beta-ketoacyl-[acyl-carrier-protein] synthase family protein [Actinomycetes bacterium]